MFLRVIQYFFTCSFWLPLKTNVKLSGVGRQLTWAINWISHFSSLLSHASQ